MMPQPAPELIKVGQLELRFIFSGAETGNALTMFEMIVPPGAGVPGSHFHVEVTRRSTAWKASSPTRSRA